MDHKFQSFVAWLLSLVMVIFILSSCNTRGNEEADGDSSDSQSGSGLYLFEPVSDEHSGIKFVNFIWENEAINFFSYPYMYHGGGVAIGDINNDGLADIYFSGNMVPNKLYLNKGNLVFEDITDSAGVAAPEGWSSGVTMNDVNNDGYLDIYVCRTFSIQNSIIRENLLFINNGDLTFTERGAEYGINDINFSTHATFFDYDNDGDNDLYVVNHPVRFEILDQKRFDDALDPDEIDRDRLYRNNGDGTFTDVGKEAGVKQYGFGLSVTISDLNNDGWLDIYVANDMEEPDCMYLNNGDGTFTNLIHEQLKHMAYFSMGADIADINNDGWADIYVVDMMAEDNLRQKTQMGGMEPEAFTDLVRMGYHHQYMRNSLQLNNGNGTFSEIGQLANVHYTDWSWAPLFADFDNDGYKDLFVSNGIKKDMRDRDFRRAFEQMRSSGDQLSFQQTMGMVPVHKINNYVYKNNGDLTFTKKISEWGFVLPGFTNGSAYGDLDNDGDLDLVLNNMEDVSVIYKNNADQLMHNNYVQFKLTGGKSNSVGIGTKVTIKYGDTQQFQELIPSRGYQSSVDHTLHFGVGKTTLLEEVIVEWIGGKVQILKDVKVNEVHKLNILNANDELQIDSHEYHLFTDITDNSGVDFVHVENKYNDFLKESLLPHKMSQFGPNIGVGDVNGDGLDDFYVGGAKGQAGALYIQKSGGGFVESNSHPWREDRGSEDLGAIFFDSDGDNDLDLYVVSGGSDFDRESPLLQDRLYTNIGNGNFRKSTGKLPQMFTSGGCVAAGDIDGDGDLDLFVGGRLVPGEYPFPPVSYILENENGSFTEVTKSVAPDLSNPGMISSAIWTDFNGDGKQDLIIVGEWTPISVFENMGGTLKSITGIAGLANTTGLWNKISAGDFDNDGDVDYVVGNLGRNNKFKATESGPLEIYANDFDNTGSIDIVLGYYNQGVCFPVRGKECSSGQMPFLAEKYRNYDSYGSSTLSDIYGDALGGALHYSAMMLSSCYLRNEGDGTFTVELLPIEAQFSTIFGLVPSDFDNDGNLDILLAGNFYAPEVETGRYDASIGLFLRGLGTGKFEVSNVLESGFTADLDVKDLVLLKTGNKNNPVVLIANNNDKVQVYRVNKPSINENLASK